ncbi:translation initiation factor IF-2 [Candidatus Woesearchaeota archaeon CG10_big_fil_rev_8_21_14_0_10_44_13]|nr:MAG: translation initiation factor IF-2 [Candidatus Woesearchaeota archaeon CG10_big_fil_rev_8_21_14_0_10_44_13]
MTNIRCNMIRSPICSVLGHVDHGKSSILDKIRGTCIVKGEAGLITQAIGASIIPLNTVKAKCGALLESLNMKFTIPGLLFIDTPGHEAFTSLRKRGGALADIAILVIDINEGFKPQTVEAIEILKSSKTPFIIAANKIDLIHGWKTDEKKPLIADIMSQNADVITKFEQKLYEIVGKLHEKFQMQSERFDRVDDYTKQIAIVPCSAKTGEGLPELIMVVTGLAQKYLEETLEYDIGGPAKGTIMEVKEDKGLGKTLDVILYDGTLKVNDTVVIGGINGSITAKVRALFQPAPLQEMREKKAKFQSVKEVVAATGVKISAPGTEDVIAGMPLRGVIKGEDIESIKEEIQSEVADVLIETEAEGIVLKADNLGSLEALIHLLKAKNIPIRNASIGNITKKDLADAESNFDNDPLKSVILGFNVSIPEGLEMSKKVKILTNDVIYRLVEEFESWKQEAAKNIEALKLDLLARPCKIKLLMGYVFRQNNPAVIGMEVLGGKAKTGMSLMNKDGKTLTEIKGMQSEQKNISEVEKGKQVAVSMDGVTVGRQINEGDVLYSAIPEEDYRKMKDLKKYLTRDEVEIIKEIAVIMRKINPVWGV